MKASNTVKSFATISVERIGELIRFLFILDVRFAYSEKKAKYMLLSDDREIQTLKVNINKKVLERD